MGTEIERKFLVTGGEWRHGSRGTRIRQGYLAVDDDRRMAIRVRIKGDKAYLNIKAVRGDDLAVRDEYEYGIPVEDANAMLDALCVRPPIDKVRHEVLHEGMLWEVDVFEGANAGLVVAEIELEDRDQPFARPAWLGEEVTDDPRFLNQSLSAHPYRDWGTPGS
jgi:adenylate cyclase